MSYPNPPPPGQQPPPFGAQGEPVPPPPPPFQGDPAAVSSDDRLMGMLCHLLGVITSVIGPLIIWLIKKDQSRFVDEHGKEALNFQISILIYQLASIPLFCVGVAFFTIPIVAVFSIVAGILAAVQANQGNSYRYPLTIRLIS
jgi:uncharacterized Tic20 family protein